ncbi:MAG: YdcF family protein [Ruminococcaceae bacterium]|nr:YdcF family protein [Oscillospiraceae bacterium]
MVTSENLRLFCRKYLLPALCFCLMVAGLFGVLVATVSLCMTDTQKENVIPATDAATLSNEQTFDYILVLGAGLRPDGTPSDMLHDRVTVGVELYHALGIPLLMSGDQTGDYNEVAAMKALAMSLGVPEFDIFLDPKGYSTYESTLRAQDIYGAKRILVVTQEYHLYRALYLSEALGMEAYGISADLRAYRGQTKRELREMLARFKDLFEGAKLVHKTFDEPPVTFA